MTIDPRISFWFSIFLAVIGFMAGATDELTTIFGPDAAKVILAWVALFLGAGSAINAVLHAIPSKSTPQALNTFMLGPKTSVTMLMLAAPGLVATWMLTHARHLIATMMIAVMLGGCGVTTVLKEGYNVVTGAQLSPTTVIVATNSFNALEATATNYLSLPRCPVQEPVCRDPRATKPLIKAIKSGRIARDNLQKFYWDHPGEIGAEGAYAALTTAISTVQGVMAQYNVH